MISSTDLTCSSFLTIYPRPTKVTRDQRLLEYLFFLFLAKQVAFDCCLCWWSAGRTTYETIMLDKILGKLKICHSNESFYFSSNKMTPMLFWTRYSQYPPPPSHCRYVRSSLDTQAQYFKGERRQKLACFLSFCTERIDTLEFGKPEKFYNELFKNPAALRNLLAFFWRVQTWWDIYLFSSVSIGWRQLWPL